MKRQFNRAPVDSEAPVNTALLLIDVINDLEFPDGDRLLEHALAMAERTAELKRQAIVGGIPVVYVNDNFGHWRSDFRAQVKHCTSDGVRGRPIAELLTPTADDYFVLKPMHSGFYGTVLELLLKHLEVRRLVLCGMASNICVLFTATDAYMRGYQLWVPADCVAANTTDLTEDALRLMTSILKADVRTSRERTLDDWDPSESTTVEKDHLIRDI